MNPFFARYTLVIGAQKRWIEDEVDEGKQDHGGGQQSVKTLPLIFGAFSTPSFKRPQGSTSACESLWGIASPLFILLKEVKLVEAPGTQANARAFRHELEHRSFGRRLDIASPLDLGM